MDMTIRPAVAQDVLKVQELRNLGWQDNYVNEETGVTKDLLVNKFASLPPPQPAIDYFLNLLANPKNKEKNLVAIIDNQIVGVIFYEELQNGNGSIGVFVDKKYRGKGIGTELLQKLIGCTNNNLEVEIYSKNKSKHLYEKCGFAVVGDEGKFYLDKDAYLPTLRLTFER